MDVLDYVNTQGQKAAAFLDAYARTSPAVQQAAEWYRAADQSGLLTVFKIVYAAHDLTNQFVDFGQHLVAAQLEPSSPDAFYFPDITDALEYDPNLKAPVKQMEDMALVAAEEAKEYALEEGRVLMTEQEELRRQQDAALQDPAKLEAEKQDAAQLEAQWEANRKADELASQSRQQEAEQKAADSLFEAVRKDQEFRQQQQADKDTLEESAQGQKKEDQPQDPEIRKLQDEQERVRADQAAQVAEFRDQLAKKYEDLPEQEKHLKEFDKAAKVADDTLVRQQAAELQKLQEQQLQRSNPPDPSRDR